MKHKLLGLTLFLTISLVACNLPFGGDTEPTEEPVASEPAATEQEPQPEATADPQEPTAAAPTAEPLANPILHIEAGRQILITHIQMVSDTLGWAIGGLQGASDHVFRTVDGGSNWSDVTPGEPRPQPGDPAKVAVGTFLDGRNGWVAYYPDTVEPLQFGLRVWSTSDAGASWTASQPLDLEFLGTTDYPPLIGFADTENGWLMARHGPAGMQKYPVYLLLTADGGLSWEPTITPAEGGLQSCRKSGVAFADSMVGWATVADCPVTAPELAMTSDGGRTWQSMPLPAPNNRPALFDSEICQAHSPQLISPDFGALAVTCQTGLKLNLIYITRDGGVTWSSFLYPGAQLEQLLLLNQRTAYGIGGQKIYQSLDGGQNWTWVKTVQWDGQFSFVSDLVGWAVARTGEALALVNTSNGGLTWGLLKPLVAP